MVEAAFVFYIMTNGRNIDIQNAISLLMEEGYEVKKQPLEITISETAITCGRSIYNINFRSKSISESRKQKIIDAVAAIVNNDRPVYHSPSCGDY